MASEIAPPRVRFCPPHYWLIERVALHTQHWTCQRCGAEQDHQDGLKRSSYWTNHRTNHQASSSLAPPAGR